MTCGLIVHLAVGFLGVAPPAGAADSRAIEPEHAHVAVTGSERPKALVTQAGRPFSFETLTGRTVVLSFVFTHCPTICPAQVRELTAVQRGLPEGLRNRVQFVSVSVDPRRDTPEALEGFATALGVDLSNWSFVTGPDDEIAALTERFKVQIDAEGANRFNHRIAVYLLDASGRLLQTYSGAPLDRPRLIREIQAANRLFNTSGTASAGGSP